MSQAFWNDYQKKSHGFACYENKDYPALALIEEAGELCGKFAKTLRGDHELDKAAVLAEVGDVLWNIAALAEDIGQHMSVLEGEDYEAVLSHPVPDGIELHKVAAAVAAGVFDEDKTMMFISLGVIARELGSSLEDVATANIQKLTDRKARNVIKGEGDNR